MPDPANKQLLGLTLGLDVLARNGYHLHVRRFCQLGNFQATIAGTSMNHTAETATKECPYCAETIKASALKCRYCYEIIDEDLLREEERASGLDRWLTPVDRPISAIAAGYLGLFSVLPLPFGLAAIACGIVALKKIKKDPTLSGKGRAWFGIVLGTIFTLIYALAISVALIENMRRG